MKNFKIKINAIKLPHDTGKCTFDIADNVSSPNFLLWTNYAPLKSICRSSSYLM
jgi:hypothetical protein